MDDIEREKKELQKKVVASVQAVAQESTNGCEIEKRDPQLAIAVIEMRAAGKTYKQIEEETGLSDSTVKRLIRNHRSVIEDMKPVLMFEASEDLALSRGIWREKVKHMTPEEIKKTRLDVIAKSHEIMAKNYALASGEGGGIKISVQTGPTLEQAMQAIDEAKRIADQRLQEKRAEAIGA